MDKPGKAESRKSVLEILREKKIALAITLGVGGAALTGCAPNAAPEPTNVAQGETPANPSDEEPTGNELPADVAEIINNPERVTAEELATMTPDQLADFATITVDEAPTPEAFAKQFATILDAWYNAGSTPDELAPHETAGKNVFESAMATKYDPVFTQGLFAEGVGVSNYTDWHAAIQTGYKTSSIDFSKPYTHAVAYLDSAVVTEGDGGFIVDVKLRNVDNLEQSSASEIYKRKNLDEIYTSRITTTIVDNTIKIVSAENS